MQWQETHEQKEAEIGMWKEYPLNPHYLVSDDGEVATDDGIVLKQYLQRSGYVNVYIDGCGGRKKAEPLHRMVAITWLGIDGYKQGLFVDHINTIRNDNRACNLRWVTPKENANNERTRLNRKLGK